MMTTTCRCGQQHGSDSQCIAALAERLAKAETSLQATQEYAIGLEARIRALTERVYMVESWIRLVTAKGEYIEREQPGTDGVREHLGFAEIERRLDALEQWREPVEAMKQHIAVCQVQAAEITAAEDAYEIGQPGGEFPGVQHGTLYTLPPEERDNLFWSMVRHWINQGERAAGA